MTPKELVAIATAAFGEKWKKPLAEAVGSSREIMWHYQNERVTIPDYQVKLIRKACRREIAKKIGVLQTLLAKLDKAA